MYGCRFVATKWRRSLQKRSNISRGISQALLFHRGSAFDVRKEDVAYGSCENLGGFGLE
jgi:hypothetical protein